MKAVNVELNEHLNRSHNFVSCDLYEFVFVNGDHFYFCDFDVDVTYLGNTYLHNACLIKRTNTEMASNLSVDKMSLTIYCDLNDQKEGTPLMHMARNGGLDNAILTCKRAFFDDHDNIIGVIKLFDGSAEVRSGGGMELKIDVKSKIQQLNVEFPQKRYYPTCCFSLYSKACGVNPEDYVILSRVAHVKDSSHFSVHLGDIRLRDGVSINDYFANGVVQFLTGRLVGKDATIKSNQGVELTLLVSEETPPSVGDMVKLYPGCDKTHDTCKHKFSHVNRDRATPYIPLKESVV